MRKTPEEMLQMAVLMKLYLAWPEHSERDLPELPEGWHWVPKGDERGLRLDIGSPSPEVPYDYDAAYWVTLQMVAERASLIDSNRGLLGMM